MLPGQSYTPEDLLRIAWRRRWLILVPLVAVASGGFVFTATLPNKYRSSTVILVVPQRIPENYVRPTVTARIEDRLVTIRQQTLSRSRLEPIITEFGLYTEERRRLAMEDVVEIMRRDIDPKVERGDAFSVSYVSEDPQLAKRVVERLAGLFISENLRDRANQADSTNTFLDGALEDAENSLLETEKRLEAYRRANAGQLPSQVNANIQAIGNIQLELRQLNESLNRDNDRRREGEKQLSSPTPSQTTAALRPVPGSTAAQLEEATAQLHALEAKGLKAEHPAIRVATRAVRDLTAALNAERTSLSGSDQPTSTPVDEAELIRRTQISSLQEEMTELDAQIARKEAEAKRLREQMASYQAKVDVAPSRESELTALTRDYATKNSLYQDLVSKREASRLAASLERQQIGEQFRVIDPPRVPERPFSPSRRLLNGLGALAGLALGVGLVAFLEYRDRSVKTAEEVLRILQLPVLALVPMMQSERDRLARRRRELLASMGAVLFAAVATATYVLWTLQAF